jgi:hypothetical protein
VHDFPGIAATELTAIGKEQTTPHQLVTGFTPVQLQLGSMA